MDSQKASGAKKMVLPSFVSVGVPAIFSFNVDLYDMRRMTGNVPPCEFWRLTFLEGKKKEEEVFNYFGKLAKSDSG